MDISVLIPAFNEQDRIAATVEAVRSVSDVGRIIVIDDGSTDDTAARARSSGAEVVESSRNGGKGAALQSGIEYLDPSASDIVALLDADLGPSASELSNLIEPVISGRADMSIARFPRPQGKAGFGMVMGLARFGIRRLGGDFDAQAPLSGQRVLNSRALDAVLPFSSGYGVEVALTIKALRSDLRLEEVPTNMRHAATGRDLAGFLHRGRQFTHVARTLMRLSFAPRQRG
ncbi:MAG: glycosyltransferase family 2 protein [Coriobacteriia bacterium]|nr:glycosyltransferase family 2 protein [Coriobacteriia bacterium]